MTRSNAPTGHVEVPVLRLRGSATAEELAAVVAALNARPPGTGPPIAYEQWRRRRQLALAR
jgi:hypothetical protein